MTEENRNRIFNLENYVYNLNLQKDVLQDKIQKYTNMKTKINSAINKLLNAKQQSLIACSTIETGIKGQRSKATSKNIEKISSRFSAISTNLSSIILPEIENNINRLKKQIQEIELDIRRTNREISILRNQ